MIFQLGTGQRFFLSTEMDIIEGLEKNIKQVSTKAEKEIILEAIRDAGITVLKQQNC